MDSDWRQLRDTIETCLNEGRYLTKWEHNFLETLAEKIDLGERLIEREREKLQQIFEEKVP